MHPGTEITFNCPACLSALRSDSSLAGCQTQCPYCGCGMEVPGPVLPTAATPVPPNSSPARPNGIRRRRKSRKPRRRLQHGPLLVKPGPAVRKLPTAYHADFAIWVLALALAISLLWLLFRNV